MGSDRRRAGDDAAFADLLAAAQAGGEWALAALYRRHDPAVRRYLSARAHGDAEDLASRTWIDAARSLSAFTGDEDAFRGWLFTIARRRLVDLIRQRSRRPEILMGEDLPEPVGGSHDDPADAVAVALAGDDAARRIMELLPPAQAEIVLLRVIGGLDVAAVAEITGRRPGTVRVMQHRALRTLAERLGDER